MSASLSTDRGAFTVVLASDSPDLEQRIELATEGTFISLPRGPLPRDPAHLFDQLTATQLPDVVVLHSDPSTTGQALELAALFDEQCPTVSVILVSDIGSEIGLPALRAGVHDVLHPLADVADMHLVISRAGRVARTRRAAAAAVSAGQASEGPDTGRVIAVVSPKGGVGKTTVATNLAVGLARMRPNSTVLVDLDIQFGDVGSALALRPEYSLADTVHGPATQDTMVLKTFLTQHSTGLYVICAPDSPAAMDTIGGKDVEQLLQMLASEFQYVVVDTAPGLSEHTLAALDHTTDLVLVTSMDVPGVRGMRKEVDVLAELGLLRESRQLVLNFAEQRGGLSIADVEATLGTAVDLLLPWSKAATISVNQGVPMLQSGVHDPLTKRLRELVTAFAPVERRVSRAPDKGGRHRGIRGRKA
jgi:pilus assembly protein CpaE